MALFNRTVITNKGQELISKIMAKKVKMIFTRIEATDFIYREQVNLNDLIRLDNPKQSSLISNAINKNNKVTLQSIFTNENLNNGYSINAIGVYAKEENGTEILFSVLVASEADFIPAKQGNNLTTINYDLVYTIDNSDKITILVENAALATAEMLNKEREERIAADDKLKIEIDTKEPKINKKSGFNLDKTNLTENDGDKLFTAKGALDLFNRLTTAINTAVENMKNVLRTDIAKKIDKTSISNSLTSTSTTTVLSSAGAKDLEDKKLNISDAWRFYTKVIGSTTDTTDLNDIIEPGDYISVSAANKWLSLPFGANPAFHLTVESIGSKYRVQTLRHHADNKMFRRVNAMWDRWAWSAWERIDVAVLKETVNNKLDKIIKNSNLTGFENSNVGIYLGRDNQINFKIKGDSVKFGYSQIDGSEKIENYIFLNNNGGQETYADIFAKNVYSNNSKAVTEADMSKYSLFYPTSDVNIKYSTETAIEFFTENTRNDFNFVYSSADKSLKCTKSGLYRISTYIYIVLEGRDNARANIKIYKNSELLNYFELQGLRNSASSTVIVRLNINDKLFVKNKYVEGTPDRLVLSGGVALNKMLIERLGD